jgi:hypothetical protein
MIPDADDACYFHLAVRAGHLTSYRESRYTDVQLSHKTPVRVEPVDDDGWRVL